MGAERQVRVKFRSCRIFSQIRPCANFLRLGFHRHPVNLAPSSDGARYQKQLQNMYIYVIRREGWIIPIKSHKIGKTSNPDTRLRSIQTGNPNPLKYSWIIPVAVGDNQKARRRARRIEYAVHKHLRFFRREGEFFWFPWFLNVYIVSAIIWYSIFTPAQKKSNRRRKRRKRK